MESFEKHWYVLHTYSGYENKVKTNIESRAQSMGMEDFIFRVVVPEEEEREIKNGKEKVSSKKTFPGYVLVQMSLSDDSWITVRTTQGVTGFIGVENKPQAIPQSEVDKILNHTEEEKPKYETPFSVSDIVKITSGPFADFIGTIDSIDQEKGKIFF